MDSFGKTIFPRAVDFGAHGIRQRSAVLFHPRFERILDSDDVRQSPGASPRAQHFACVIGERSDESNFSGLG